MTRPVRYLVRVADPSTIGGRRFPREKRFEVLREAERYARRANERGLGATIHDGSLEARLAEIRRENAIAAASRRQKRLPWSEATAIFALEWDGEPPADGGPP